MPERWTTEPTRRLLVIADDQDTGELLSRLLDRAGWRTDLAFAAAAGMSELDGTTYPALVVDMVTAGDTLDVVRSARDTPGGATLRILACLPAGSDPESARAAGADGSLVHPFTGEQLVAGIAAANGGTDPDGGADPRP